MATIPIIYLANNSVYIYKDKLNEPVAPTEEESEGDEDSDVDVDPSDEDGD